LAERKTLTVAERKTLTDKLAERNLMLTLSPAPNWAIKMAVNLAEEQVFFKKFFGGVFKNLQITL
jgi:hypothetical protein